MTISTEISVDLPPGLDTPPSGLPVELAWDQTGGLGIRERQAWATWQMVTASALALVVGMFIGYSGKKPSSSAGGGQPLVSLTGDKPSSPSTATLTPAAAPGTGAGETPTTATTATTAGTAPAPVTGPAVVLVANTQGKGSTDLPSFTAAGAWNIGWQFRCLQTPTGTGTFSVAVVPDAGGAAAPALEKTGREDKGVTEQSTLGAQHLRITSDPACQWAVKVTGLAG